MKFIVDENLPPQLAEWLRRRGHDAVHVRDIGLAGGPDKSIAERARRGDAIIISRDEDFDHFALSGACPGVLRVTLGNASTPDLIAWIEHRLEAGCAAFAGGKRVVLI